MFATESGLFQETKTAESEDWSDFRWSGLISLDSEQADQFLLGTRKVHFLIGTHLEAELFRHDHIAQDKVCSFNQKVVIFFFMKTYCWYTQEAP